MLRAWALFVFTAFLGLAVPAVAGAPAGAAAALVLSSDITADEPDVPPFVSSGESSMTVLIAPVSRVNWFAYAGGDPVNRWDPSGLDYITYDDGDYYWEAESTGERFHLGSSSGTSGPGGVSLLIYGDSIEVSGVPSVDLSTLRRIAGPIDVGMVAGADAQHEVIRAAISEANTRGSSVFSGDLGQGIYKGDAFAVFTANQFTLPPIPASPVVTRAPSNPRNTLADLRGQAAFRDVRLNGAYFDAKRDAAAIGTAGRIVDKVGYEVLDTFTPLPAVAQAGFGLETLGAVVITGTAGAAYKLVKKGGGRVWRKIRGGGPDEITEVEMARNLGTQASLQNPAIASLTGYRKTFFEAHPELYGEVVVHHAIERQVLKKYPSLFSAEEIHGLANLRGIPKSINSEAHLSQIRLLWNRFYTDNPNASKVDVINYAREIDQLIGDLFKPKVGY